MAAQLQITVRDAFMAARRQLIEHAERGQGADRVRRPRGRLPVAAETPADE